MMTQIYYLSKHWSSSLSPRLSR